MGTVASCLIKKNTPDLSVVMALATNVLEKDCGVLPAIIAAAVNALRSHLSSHYPHS